MTYETDNVAERRIDRALRDDEEIRNKERALLGKVLSSRITKRGGLSKERTRKYPYHRHDLFHLPFLLRYYWPSTPDLWRGVGKSYTSTLARVWNAEYEWDNVVLDPWYVAGIWNSYNLTLIRVWNAEYEWDNVGEIDELFKKGKILPVLGHEIAEEKRLREVAVNELKVCDHVWQKRERETLLIVWVNSGATCEARGGQQSGIDGTFFSKHHDVPQYPTLQRQTPALQRLPYNGKTNLNLSIALWRDSSEERPQYLGTAGNTSTSWLRATQ